MKKIFLLGISCLFLAGCWNYDENLIVHRDGSATLTVNLRIARQIRQQLKLDEFFDRQYLQKLLPPAAEIRQLHVDTHRVLNRLLLEVYIPDLQAAAGSFGQESQLFGKVTFSFDEQGNFIYQRSLHGIGEKIRESLARQGANLHQNKTIAAIINRSFFNYRLETPLTVLKSNASKIEGKVLTWKVPVSRLTGPEEMVLSATFRKPPSLLLIGILAALLLLLIGGGVWYAVRRWKQKRKKPVVTEYVTTYTDPGE